MQTKIITAIAVAGMMLSGCAKNYVAVPLAGPDQQVRFVQGIPTTLSDKPDGSIQLTPLGYIQEDNRLVFGAAAFNKGRAPVNFGLDSVSARSNGQFLKLYTRDELAHEAKVKAIWAAVAVGLAGAAAAYSANANAYSSTNGYIAGPRGVTTFSATTYNPALAYAGTAAATAATGYGMNSIRNSLDNTISQLNGSILQINTVDPGASAGGEIVVDLPKAKDFPQPLSISFNWSGTIHNFSYTIKEAKN